MTKTTVAAPAPRPSNEELIKAISAMTLRELCRLRDLMKARVG